MRQLGERGCINVLVEAGGRLTGGLFDRDLVDKVVVYVSTTKIIGGSDALSPVGGCGPSVMRDSHDGCATRVSNDLTTILPSLATSNEQRRMRDV